MSDPVAFARWCEAHGIDHHGRPSVEFPEWFTGKDNLRAIVEDAGGEMPDGLEDTLVERKPSLRVSQTQDQSTRLLAEFITSAALLEAATLVDGDAQ
ncbi:hypothetical protein G7Y41_08885 [Schaalia sp. ZJ405]|uniref:hypothetical protein n=1 Tax=Schaalia sp. ZJ405 TaxID=2709403 RepID=UPI0018C94DD7|nr:hypothetical protein [Schaalia sp. ZJ405]QPK81140.1 hypothetical protein G7Y41_08885 [Schaalia sp. ZJ405]